MSVEWLKSRARKADLNERETHALLGLAERADLNPRRLERLLTSDDLNDIQASAARKFVSDHRDDRDGDRDDRLGRTRLMRLGIEADLNDRELDALMELAERTDFNRDRFHWLLGSDDLNDIQASAVRKFAARNSDDDKDREDDDRGRDDNDRDENDRDRPRRR